MVEALELRFGRPSLPGFGSKEMMENTVMIIPDLPKGFNYADFKLKITPIGNVSILPVFALDGEDLKDDKLEEVFLMGSLGLYTPQRSEGDQFLVEFTEGAKTSNPRHLTILMQFSKGEWKRSSFQLPLTIQPNK